jgi:hypothetical protein
VPGHHEVQVQPVGEAQLALHPLVHGGAETGLLGPGELGPEVAAGVRGVEQAPTRAIDHGPHSAAVRVQAQHLREDLSQFRILLQSPDGITRLPLRQGHRRLLLNPLAGRNGGVRPVPRARVSAGVAWSTDSARVVGHSRGRAERGPAEPAWPASGSSARRCCAAPAGCWVSSRLQAREAAARVRVDELQAEAAELAVRLERAREDLSRLEITRETVAQVLAELSTAETEAEPDVSAEHVPEPEEALAPHGVGVMVVLPWRDGLVTARAPPGATSRARKAKGLITCKPLSRRRRRKPFHGLAAGNATSRLGTKSCRFSEVMSRRRTRKLGGAARAPPSRSRGRGERKDLSSFGVNEKEAPSWPRRGQR